MFRVVALPALLLALVPYQSSIEPLPRPTKAQLKARGFWHQGCPVPLSDLRLLTVSHRSFRGRTRSGQSQQPDLTRRIRLGFGSKLWISARQFDPSGYATTGRVANRDAQLSLNDLRHSGFEECEDQYRQSQKGALAPSAQRPGG